MKVYNVEHTAEALGCGRRTVYRLAMGALKRTRGPFTLQDIDRMRAYQRTLQHRGANHAKFKGGG
jgi:hypothetical protein